jgi:hypothetical protein
MVVPLAVAEMLALIRTFQRPQIGRIGQADNLACPNPEWYSGWRFAERAALAAEGHSLLMH